MFRLRTLFSLTLVTLLVMSLLAPATAAASGRSLTVAELLQRSQPAPSQPAPQEPAPEPVPAPAPSQPSDTAPRTGGVTVADLMARFGNQPTTPAPSAPTPTPSEPTPSEPAPAPQPEPSPTPSRGITVADLLNPTPTQPSAPTGPINLPPLPAGLTAAEQQMVNYLNQERIQAGLPALQVDMELVRLARLKAEDIAELNYNGHNSPTLGTPSYMARQAGYRFTRLGETIVKTGSVLHGHKQLMGSLAHRNILLSPNYTRLGTGIAYYNGRHNIRNGLVAVHLLAD